MQSWWMTQGVLLAGLPPVRPLPSKASASVVRSWLLPPGAKAVGGKAVKSATGGAVTLKPHMKEPRMQSSFVEELIAQRASSARQVCAPALRVRLGKSWKAGLTAGFAAPPLATGRERNG